MGEGVGYHDLLPVSWTPLGEPLAAAAEASLVERNLALLHTVATLQERRMRGDSATPAELEVERLHHKVDLLLELTGAILRLHRPLPEPVPVRVSHAGVSWSKASDAPAAGARVMLSLHLHPCAVNAFAWPATIEAVGDEIVARFDATGDALDAALEKHVFMHHRRSVAGSRQPAAR